MVKPIGPTELPYVTSVPSDGRNVVYMPFYDNEQKRFHVYPQQHDGSFVGFSPKNMVSGTYISRAIADEFGDIRAPLSELVFQHFTYKNILNLASQIEHDLLNALTSINKYFVLLKYANEAEGCMSGSVISTELEYAIGNHRSFYDLLNRLVMQINKTYNPSPQQLKDSFAKLAQRDRNYLMGELALPEPIADFYVGRSNIFLVLRDIRDNIFHHGHTPDFIFIGQHGFSVRTDNKFNQSFRELNLWPESLLRPNRIGSLLAVFELIVCDMFQSMDMLSDAIRNSFSSLPNAMAKDHQVFLRSHLARHFYNLPRYRDEHWFDPSDILAEFE